MASTRTSRSLLRAGLALVAAGMLLLCYIGWQYFGTNWVAQRKQAAIEQKVERVWDTARAAPGPPSSGQATVDVDDGRVLALVRIPRFGEGYQVPVLEGTDDDVLGAGLGHFTGSAGPGGVGNFALAGHRITHGEPLRDMPDLVTGDTITVETVSTLYTYSLVTSGSDLVVPFTASWVLDPDPRNPDAGGPQPPQGPRERVLTLTTCSELFHTDDRLVAFATLVEKVPIS